MRIRIVISILLFAVSYLAWANGPFKQKNSPVKILITVKADHAFSNPMVKDHFEISLIGRSVAGGKISLSIFSNDHKLIFRDSFPANHLLYDLDEEGLLSAKQKEQFIRKNINRFFADSCFIYPAIKIAEPFYDDNSNKAIWLDIKSNKQAIGFVYSHGYEGTYAIAYSKKKQKVVQYFSSD